MRIELHFRYTIDDVRDALKPELRSSRRVRPSPRWQVITVSILAIPALATALLFGWRGEILNSEPVPPLRDLLFLLGSSVVPALIVVSLMLSSMLRTARRAKRSRDAAAVAAERRPPIVLSILFGIAIILWTLLIMAPAVALPWEPPRVIAVLIGVVPWTIAFALVIVLNRITRRRSIELQWNTRPTWRRDKSFVLDDDDGLLVRDEMASAIRRWAYFVRARETAISLLLHDEEGLVHIIPKRAFADEVEIARARWMIEQHVKDVQFLPQTSAFPVVTAPPAGGVVEPALGTASTSPSTERSQSSD